MNLKRIAFSELENYNKIEMLKQVNQVRKYSNLNDYTLINVEDRILDFARDESMDLWRTIMNHDSCAIFVIEERDSWVAGCVVVTNSPEVNMLRGNMENSVLWDIRVDSSSQRKGYGQILFSEAVKYSKEMSCKRMIIETQNNNSKAISFYEKQDAKLYEINLNHYEDCENEDQLIFMMDLDC